MNFWVLAPIMYQFNFFRLSFVCDILALWPWFWCFSTTTLRMSRLQRNLFDWRWSWTTCPRRNWRSSSMRSTLILMIMMMTVMTMMMMTCSSKKLSEELICEVTPISSGFSLFLNSFFLIQFPQSLIPSFAFKLFSPNLTRLFLGNWEFLTKTKGWRRGANAVKWVRNWLRKKCKNPKKVWRPKICKDNSSLIEIVLLVD